VDIDYLLEHLCFNSHTFFVKGWFSKNRNQTWEGYKGKWS